MPEIIIANKEGIRSILFNRPERLNAINLPMLEALDGAVDDAMRAPDVRCLLLSGNGRAFCAGDDVEDQAAICDAGEARLREQLALLQRISGNLVLGPKPVVAMAGGWAIGAGFSWLLNCDFVVCASDMRAFFPEVGFGTFVTGGATSLLPRLVGPRRAHDLLFLGRKMDAAELVASGIASRQVAPDLLETEGRRLAAELAALPARACQWMKRSLAEIERTAFAEALDREIEACVTTTLNADTVERMRASLTRKH